MFDIDKELKDKGLDYETYENMLDDLQSKTHRESDLDWSELSDKYSLGWTGDAIRKASQVPLIGGTFVKEYYEQKIVKENTFNEDEYLKKINEKKQEIQKETIKMRDERNALNKVIREQARRESIVDLIERKISESVYPIDLSYSISKLDVDHGKSMVINLTDLHAGIIINSFFNEFNEDILLERFQKYLDKIISIQKMHKCNEVYVIISEIISGFIHDSLRIENNENVIEQFKMVSEIISSFITNISEYFEDIYVYITPGNHSRLMQSKEQSIKGENLDILLPFYLKARLQNLSNIHIEDNIVDSDIAVFNIRNHYAVAVHGDKDSPNNVVHKMTLLLKQQPDFIFLGHRHTNSMITVNDTKVISNGCMSGSDNYAIEKRLRNKPEQTVCIIDDNGLDCLYDVKLD